MQLKNCLLFTCTVSEVTCNLCASFSAKGSMILIRLPKGGRSMTQRDEETALGIFYTKRIQLLTLTWGRTDDDQILTKVFSFNFTTRLRPWRHQGEPANTEAHLEQLRFHGGRDGGGVDELEGGGRVVWVLRGELHQHLDAVAATVHGHCAAPVCCVHLRGTHQELL